MQTPPNVPLIVKQIMLGSFKIQSSNDETINDDSDIGSVVLDEPGEEEEK